jgi:Predicted acyltransferases
MPTKRRLDRIEALRGLAALYIFVHHYATSVNWNQYHLGSYATVAVMTFFLISGFVIYRSSGVGGGSFSVSSYARKRVLRIMPAYLVALALSYGVDVIIHGNPFNVSGFLGNMAFLVESRSVRGVFAFHHNAPLWSLSYEMWFYVFFAVMVLAAGKRFEVLRRCAVGLSVVGLLSQWIITNPVSLYAGAFVIWWAGAELAHEYNKTGGISWRGQLRSLASMVFIAALVTARIVAGKVGFLGATHYPTTQLSHLVIGVLLIVAALLWQGLRMRGFDVVIGPFRRVAPVSYGIYIFHFPIVLLAANEHVTGSAILDLLWVVPTVFGLAWLFDLQLHRLLVKRLDRPSSAARRTSRA